MEKIQNNFWAYKGMYIQRLYDNEWIVLDKNERHVAARSDMRNAKSYIDAQA
jgi:hypothetical protein